MNKQSIRSIRCVPAVIIVLLIAVVICGVLFAVNRKEPLEVGSFELADYQQEMEAFPSDETIGSFSDTQELLDKVEVILTEVYGESIKQQKPFRVFYDENNSVWLVQGTLPPDTDGGAANILVDNHTGKVLAVWHEK